MIAWEEKIQTQFNKVITYSQNIINPQTTELFTLWAKNKYLFSKSMNGQLIYEFPQPVTLELDAETKSDRLTHFFDWVEHFSDSLRLFLENQIDGFYDNKTISNYYFVEENTTIPAGMKINKAIGRYWKNQLDPAQIDVIQCEISRLIQENKVTGKLCLSIHPLDFLSISENNHNWRSCHALDGEYRSGNLSYMIDPVTVIAYIKSDDQTILPHFPEDVPWNNKKWRCLFFFDFNRSMVYAGRQYPFFSENALNLVRQCLFERFNYFLNKNIISAIGMPWKHNCFTGDCKIEGEHIYFNKPHIFEGNTCIPLEQWVQDAVNTLHFNDLLRSSFYTPWTLHFRIQSSYTLMQQDPFIIGAAVPCLRCGKIEHNHQIYDSNVMVCHDCILEDDNIEADWIGHCSICGVRLIIDDSYCSDEGEYYCDHCLDEHVHQCEKCGTTFSDLIDAVYTGANGETLCWCCASHNH